MFGTTLTVLTTAMHLCFHVIENGWEEVVPGFVIAGVPAHHRDDDDERVVEEALSNRPPGGATLRLAHRPIYEYATTAAALGVSCMLSGHTHGRTDLAFRLAGALCLSAARGTRRGGRHARHRLSRRGYMGTAHAPLGTGRNST